MAEVVGLVFGGLGVVGIFSVCVQAFDMIQVARTQDRRLRVLATKLDNQKARFIIWGESLGLHKSEGLDMRAEHPVIAKSICRSCELVYELFTDSNQLQLRYGLAQEVSGTSGGLIQSRNSDQSVWRHTFSRVRTRIAQSPQPAIQPATSAGHGRTHITRWVIKDQKQFEELVKDLRELIDDLQSLTDFRGIPERQREITTVEIQSITDQESIRLLQEASVNEESIISDAASVRAITLGVDDLASTIETYCTAPESQSAGVAEEPYTDIALNDSERRSVVPQNQRVVQRDRAVDSKAGAQWRSAAALQPISARALLMQRHEMNILETDLGWNFHTSFNMGPLTKLTQGRNKRIRKEVKMVFDESSDTILVTYKPLPNSDGIHLVGSVLGPPGSPYEDGIFHILMILTLEYPFKAPIIRCITKVYHPNIDAQGRICVDVLSEKWNPGIQIRTALVTVQQLLGSPEPDDPIVPEIASTFINEPELYAKNARIYTQRYATQVSPSAEQVQRAIDSAMEAARRGENGDSTHTDLLRREQSGSNHNMA